jgi:hypothetical protein
MSKPVSLAQLNRTTREGCVLKFFKSEDPKFLRACTEAGIPPTRRQASKWLAGKGAAWKNGRS